MRIKMLHNHTAALDGVNATEYVAGEEYDVPAEAAARWQERGIAAVPGAPEVQALPASPATVTLAATLEGLKVPELQVLAAEQGIEAKGLKKADLVLAITEAVAKATAHEQPAPTDPLEAREAELAAMEPEALALLATELGCAYDSTATTVEELAALVAAAEHAAKAEQE
jgi:hypothetical protein